VEKQSEELQKKEDWLRGSEVAITEAIRLRDIERQYHKQLFDNEALKRQVSILGSVANAIHAASMAQARGDHAETAPIETGTQP
jgi:hypothetical protein